MKLIHAVRLTVVVILLLRCAGSYCLAGPTDPCTVKTAFGPDCERLLISKIKEGQKEIKVAIFTFTKKSIGEALIDRAERGVKVTVKIDAHEAEYQYTQELLARLVKAKIKVVPIKMQANVLMHNKFAVVDGRCVVTGSYNWTKKATEENWENTVAIESTAIAGEFAAEWERIKSAP